MSDMVGEASSICQNGLAAKDTAYYFVEICDKCRCRRRKNLGSTTRLIREELRKEQFLY